MTIAIVLLALLAVGGTPTLAGPDYERYAELLDRYVTPDGVRYEAWRGTASDVEALANAAQALESVDPAALTRDERLAFYINLYNVEILRLIVMAPPVASIRDLSRDDDPFEIFDRPIVNIGEAAISLNDLEGRLRNESGDPRIHFAVNCASRSCPPIAPSPFRGASLDEQLERATREYLGQPGVITFTPGAPTLSVPRIFGWYADDFREAGGVEAFLARYVSIESDSPRLVFREYDWSLNAAPAP